MEHAGTRRNKLANKLQSPAKIKHRKVMRCCMNIGLFVLLSFQAEAQQNLVVNGGFENPPNCPSASVSFAASAMGWVSGTEVGTPDHFHTCVTIDPLAVPCNWRGCQEPRTGDGYAGIWAFSKYHPEAREYIQTQLIQPLYPGVRYEVRFYVSLAEHMGGYAISTMGAALTAESPDTLDGGLRLNADPQVLYQGPPLTDTINWILITDTIVSRGDNERFLTIGNFFADGDSDTLLFNPNAQLSELAYYFIDNLSVVALDSVPSGVGIDEVERERAIAGFSQTEVGIGQQEAAELNSIQPTNSVERTLKDVLTVLYSNAADLRTLSEETTEQLREIARRCPLDDGFGVYMARSALLKLDTLPRNYHNDCELLQSPDEQRNKTIASEDVSEFSIYPNPSNGQFTLAYQMNEMETGEIRMFDMVGKQVFAQTVSGEAKMVNMNLSELSTGLYLISLEVNGEVRFAERLSILK